MEFYKRPLASDSIPVRVSIPNGMEFYFMPYDATYDNTKGFQFPTGWNSTTWLNCLGRFVKSFNSQRDGILLYAVKAGLALLRRVSIPNGMEFYTPVRLWARCLPPVSIPNGMEFYLLSLSCFLVGKSFNSQRDGILPVICGISKACWSCFNSQRDGILPYKFASFCS